MPWKWIRLVILVLFCSLELTLSVYNRYHSTTGANVSYAGHGVRGGGVIPWP